MDIKTLNTFIAVSELQSFTKAAERLGYSQSTISFQIRQLEAELGVMLLDRINRTVALTDAGNRFLKAAYGIRGALHQFHTDISGNTEVSGHVRLAAASSLCSGFVGKIYMEMQARFPEVTLEIIEADTHEMFRLLDHNEVDLVCTLDFPIYDRGYTILCERETEVRFVASPSNPLARQEQITLEDLLEEPFLLTEKNMSYRKILDDRLAAESMEIKPKLTSGNTMLLTSLIQNNAGISFLPEYVIHPFVKDGSIVCLDVDTEPCYLWIQLLHHRDKWLSDAISATAGIFREFLEKKSGLFRKE
ncbi:MAG: LysR family transcriptional regulator [Lachnospiraceae bacterium]|nr:LysR family transcriptional regulator [Lachnospiraceae bacterium]